MIFYSGWGLTIPVFGIVGLVVSAMVGEAIGEPIVGPSLVLSALAGGASAAGLSWWAGARLQVREQSKVMIDCGTGKKSQYPSRHSFMFVPMHYYALVYAVLFGLIALGGLVLPQ